MTDRSKATTHAEVCWSWGPAHYECAVREIERLRKMHQDVYQRGLQAGARGLREMYDAIQEVKRQDAWGNTRLTEALMAAEERAERAEAENKRLREELSKMWAEPSDEEIDAIIGKHFQLPGNACRAHVAIAEVLRAQPAASAEPVASDHKFYPHPGYRAFCQKCGKAEADHPAAPVSAQKADDVLRRLVDEKFSSGNAIPVERITVTRQEYEAVIVQQGNGGTS